MMNQLLHHTNVGYAWASRILSFMILGFITLATFLIRPRKDLIRSEEMNLNILKDMWKDKPFVVVALGCVVPSSLILSSRFDEVPLGRSS